MTPDPLDVFNALDTMPEAGLVEVFRLARAFLRQSPSWCYIQHTPLETDLELWLGELYLHGLRAGAAEARRMMEAQP